ncbi:serine protease FAM111A-like isoform X2 [Triplophysa dalaica]|uniref:serine protease FAM111A-like isoform X2 n=1 Tax=Triplophysa dalaica TaxID=1582913 RepID=UPI0024E015F4|nr:serine protease FAM111A-like isoform X2 [Triplophysa dalaica]XP_056602264.1 serine protease FAM111A-like isoform X2 [Triplophysa dalaica]
MSSQPKRMKQTEIRTSLSHVGNSERMDKVPKKEVSNEVSKDQQQDKEEKSFKYRLNSEKYSVHCDPSMTVLDALNTSHVFKKEKEKTKNKDKQVLILTSKQQMPTAALKMDFPCCLIDNDVIIDVDFIKNDRSDSMKQNKNLPLPSNPDMFVIFYIKKKGGDKIQLLLKSEALRKRVEYVCVYALKEDTLKIALKRDGRFKKIMFQKHCALYESGTESSHEMSQPVKHLDQKIFNVIVLSNTKQPDSLEDWTLPVKTEPDVASDVDVADDADTRQTPVNTEHETKHKKNPNNSTRPSARRSAPKEIPHSGEIRKLLLDQFTGLLQQLKQRENLRDNAQVKKFFREEYDKSVESFSEVKKVREIMRLCDSVCQIRRQGSSRGTGFLLFNGFILTNAHVIEKCNASDITAVFGYEDLDQNTKRVPIKDITCFFYGKDDEDNHLDYALLEFNSDDDMAKYPQLLDHYRQDTPDNRSEICIVGHPEGQVKKMDPCFVIGGDNRSEAADEHVSKNISFYHVMTQESLKQKWDFRKNQITYDSCFFHGSSGSPVFDADCKLIGIHTGGYVYHENKTKSVMEYAYAMQPILDNIKAKCRVKGRTDIVNIFEDKIRGDAP